MRSGFVGAYSGDELAQGKEGEGKGRKGKKEIMKERKKARKEEGRRTNSKTEGSSP